MSKPSKRGSERKLQVVLSVLRAEVSVAEAARRGVAGVGASQDRRYRRPRGLQCGIAACQDF